MPITGRNYDEGEILFIDKPYKWTSFDIVNKVKKKLKHVYEKNIKVGHAGTLDPLASGLMIICTGKFTKRIEEFQGLVKEYTGEFYIGATTPSYDLETIADIDNNYEVGHITEDLVKSTALKFKGSFEQIPPTFSAKKIDGKRAYKMARKGEDVIMRSNAVTINEFFILRQELPIVEFKISCSKGTYIRSIARDFGKELNSGAYLNSLRRTKIGDYHINDAMTIEDFCMSFEE
ncbi:MAG: tRNA pseudouridine(55) synthase TruB [Bacteroidota bacterium]|nr:tRNA pseudouridine(55) synthase TruB [Bacteroidota bacterium]